MSRPLSVNQSVRSTGLQSKPTELRTPRATVSDRAAVDVHALDDAVTVVGQADVARRADRHVELAVGAEGDEAAAVVRLRGKAVADEHRRRRRGELVVDAVEAKHARQRADEERAVAIRDAGRQLQVGGDGAHVGAAARPVLDGVDLARARAADVDDALAVGAAAERHLARVGNGVGEELDAKAVGHAQLVELRRRRGDVPGAVAAMTARTPAAHAMRATRSQPRPVVIAMPWLAACQRLDARGGDADLRAGADDLAPRHRIDRDAFDAGAAPSSRARARPAS